MTTKIIFEKGRFLIAISPAFGVSIAIGVGDAYFGILILCFTFVMYKK